MLDSARFSSITTISSAMIMAAGLGTRLRPFTLDSPKPLLPLMGAPVLQYALDALAYSQLGVTRAVLNHSHLSEKLQSGVASLENHSLEPILSDESSLLMGSAGGLRKALPHLGSDRPFLLMNGDVICGIQLRDLVRTHLRLRESHGVTITLAIHCKSPGEGSYRQIHVNRTPGYDFDAGVISGLGDLQRHTSFFSGYAVIEPECVMDLPLDQPSEFVPSLLQPAIQRGRAGAYLFQDPWIDIGSPGLWLDAHLELMMRMETGDIPNQWRRRIEAETHRHANGLWSSTRLRRGHIPTEQCMTPVFVGCSEAEMKEWSAIGPRAVVYGPPELGVSTLSDGITWNRRTWRRTV